MCDTTANIVDRPSSYIVAIAPDYESSFLNLIVPTAAKTTTYVNGLSADGLATFQQIQSSGYWGAQIPWDAETTQTVTSSQPISVQVYGWGGYDSYGYSGN